VCLSSARWDNPFRGNRQQIMRVLSREHNILFVHLSVSLSFRQWLRELISNSHSSIPLKQVNPRVWLYTPPYNFFPGLRFKPMMAIRDWLVAAMIRKSLRKLGWQKYIVWTYYFGSSRIVNRLGGELKLYDCVDNHAGYALFHQNLKSSRRIEVREQALMKAVDILINLSRPSHERNQTACPRAYHVSTGVEFELFNRGADNNLPLPPDLMSVPAPRAGFIGSISLYRFDADLISYVAQKMPRLSIVLIGRTEDIPAIRALGSLPHVYFLGHKPYDLLPDYLRGFDLCLGPYPLNPHTNYISPLKFLEYLAAGKPVVSTPIAELVSGGFSDLISIAENREEFVSLIQHHLTADDPEEKFRRIEYARRNTWEKRTERILKIIGNGE
ncbi:MAG: glycosyltransferase, partial [Candidatus Auribacterota bacterium]|nr:glycosyltransferase [Candidatus Auribacterota bacterium]